MPVRVDTLPDSGLLVVHDAEVSLPVIDRDKMNDWERAAAAGKLFFLAAEDPIRFQADVYAGETLPAELGKDFQPLGGTFLLDLPSGRLMVAGYDLAGAAAGAVAIAVPRGPSVLTVMERRPVDGRRHQREMVALVGESDWKFVERTDRLSLLGCLPVIVALAGLLFAFRRGQWRGFLYFALPLLILAWAPHVLLRNSTRYRRIQRLMNEHEAAKPHFIFSVAPVERSEGLSGGFLNV